MYQNIITNLFGLILYPFRGVDFLSVFTMGGLVVCFVADLAGRVVRAL